MIQGFLQISRSIVDWDWYTDSNTLRVFLHLLLKAQYVDKQYQGIMIKRGQVVTSRSILSKELGISEQNVRTALAHLKSTNEITTELTSTLTNRVTVVTICKYESWQGLDNTTNQSTNQMINQSINRELTNDQPITITKERDKDNNKKNIIKKENIQKKEKSEDEVFVDEIYEEYPKKCPLNNRSTNKSYKDKERIRRLMKIYSKEDIRKVVIAEKEKVGKSYLRNFSTFLNNFPDPNSISDNNTSLQTKENKDNNVLFGADYPASVDDVQKCDIHSYPNPWYEWMYERCPKVSKGARKRYNDWDKIDQNWTKFVNMCGGEKTLSYACLVLERDGYEEYYDKNGFMWMIRNFLEKNGLYNGK